VQETASRPRSTFDVVEPDLRFIPDGRMRVLTDKHVRGAPDLVVEIASQDTRRRDEGVKLVLYEPADVVEYWIVDPDTESVHVYRRRGGRLACVQTLVREPGAQLTSPLLPGAALALDAIFEK